jgi:hypothetical protein
VGWIKQTGRTHRLTLLRAEQEVEFLGITEELAAPC